MLRLNTSIDPAGSPSRLGVLGKDTAGFPNGRRLADDVVDIELQALEGAVRTMEIVQPLATGDGINSNDKEFGSSFPYVALPHSGSVGLESRSGGTSGSSGSGGGSGSGSPSGGVGAGFGGAAGESVPVAAGAVLGLGVLLGAAGLVTLRRARRSGTV